MAGFCGTNCDGAILLFVICSEFWVCEDHFRRYIFFVTYFSMRYLIVHALRLPKVGNHALRLPKVTYIIFSV